MRPALGLRRTAAAAAQLPATGQPPPPLHHHRLSWSDRRTLPDVIPGVRGYSIAGWAKLVLETCGSDKVFEFSCQLSFNISNVPTAQCVNELGIKPSTSDWGHKCPVSAPRREQKKKRTSI